MTEKIKIRITLTDGYTITFKTDNQGVEALRKSIERKDSVTSGKFLIPHDNIIMVEIGAEDEL